MRLPLWVAHKPFHVPQVCLAGGPTALLKIVFASYVQHVYHTNAIKPITNQLINEKH